MAHNYILHIDTALETARVSIADGDRLLAVKESRFQNEHAAFGHTAIGDLLKECAVESSDIKAIAVVSGPGSYTGLRVGMAAAKGLCYALNLPLISINTLALMAHSVINRIYTTEKDIICPMIDARRQEVYMAIYRMDMTEIIAPKPYIFDSESKTFFSQFPHLIFTGTGAEKWQKQGTNSTDFRFITMPDTTQSFVVLSWVAFLGNNFENLFYAEPQYLKNNYQLPQKPVL